MPVIGLSYIDHPLCPAETARKILQTWPTIRGAKSLVLLNGVWVRAPELQTQVLDLARRTHVIVADQVVFAPKQLFGALPSPVHLVTVSSARECPEWLRVEVQAL